MQVEVWKDGNVAEHDDPQEIKVGESEIPRIWHLNAPEFCFTHVTLCPVEAKEFSCHTDWIEYYKCRVSTKFEKKN